VAGSAVADAIDRDGVSAGRRAWNMSVMYVLGNLVGRALTSYALVWLVCWIASRFQWRAAFRLSMRWYSVLGVVLLTLLGIGAAVNRGGGL
jgi:hypothetical protein